MKISKFIKLLQKYIDENGDQSIQSYNCDGDTLPVTGITQHFIARGDNLWEQAVISTDEYEHRI